MSLNHPLIIVTSDEPWGDVMHTQLHYAYQLSKDYDVIYLNPPRVWSPSSGFVDYKRIFRVNSRLLVVPYRHLFPVRYFRPFFTFLNDLLTSYTLRKYIPDGLSDIVIWRFDLFRFYRVFLPGRVRGIYHVIGNYIGKSGDQRLAADSDLVVVTNPRLKKHYEGLNPHVIHVPQCIPEEDHLVDQDIIDRIRNRYGNILLFIGTISADVDLTLLEKLATRFQDCNLIIIGPVTNVYPHDLDQLKRLQAISNVHFIGSIHGLELKNYIRAAEICLVPYKVSNGGKTNSRSPLKILNYISQRKPVVSTIESGIENEWTMGIHLVSDAEGFISKVDALRKQPVEIDGSKIDAYLGTVHYRDRIAEILREVDR